MSGESILVVEDNGVIALQLGELLEKNGYRISGTTAYGEDAVEMAEKNPPHLICMDIELMGKIDGIETARRIHEHADIPVIYLTAYSDSRRFALARETGPYNYIVKPFNERELLASVDLALHRHAIDQRFRETMQRYRAIVDNAAEGILLISCDTGAILEANPASIQLLGYTEGELSGMNVGDIIATPAGQDRGQCGHIFLPGGWSGEVQCRRRDGSLRDVELTSRIIPRGGAPARSCMMIHDITELKLAEKAVRRANKKLNLLSGITRHDINNHMTVVLGYLAILSEDLEDSASRDIIMKILESSRQISDLIQFTKTYEDIGVNAPVWQDCRTLVETAAQQVPAGDVTMKNNIPVRTEVFADPLIVKVFFNLMDNALRYGGKITTIRFSVQKSGQDYLIICEDDGDGIPVELKEKIFERGFGKNTGLGLFLSREILSITGITIRETGEPDTGARFEMVVPHGSFRV